MNRTVMRLLRVGGSVLLLGVVIALLPRGELAQAFGVASPGVLLVAVGVFVAGHVAAACKWRMLMGSSTDLSLAQAVRAHVTGLVGTLSPFGLLGGDVVRAAVAMRASSQPGTIMVAGLIDRLVDTAALLVLATTGLLWLGGRSPATPLVVWGGAGVLLAAIAVLLGARRLLARRWQRLAGLRDAFETLAAHPGLIARALLLSIVIQGAFITTNAYIGAQVGVESPFAAWLFAWPAAKFAAYLPIGVAGIGVREVALVALLRPLGGAPGAIVAAGLLWDLVLVTGSLAGWLVLCVLRPAAPAAALLRRAQTP